MLVAERTIVPEFQVAVTNTIGEYGGQFVAFEIEIVIEDAIVSICQPVDDSATHNPGGVTKRKWRPAACPEISANAEHDQQHD
jgi:hypothetical protein